MEIIDSRQQHTLIAEHDRLATAAAARYRRRARDAGLDPDDVEQAARMALVEAVARYRPELGPFAAYACKYIKGNVCRLFEAEANEPGSLDPEVLDGREDQRATERRRRDDRDDDVREALTRLPADQADVLSKHHGLHDGRRWSRRELAYDAGQSPGTIRAMLDAAAEALRDELGD